MAKAAFLVLKVALSALLVWYAFSKIDLSSAWTTMRSITARPLVVVALVFLCQFLLAGLRLRTLLNILGTRVPLLPAVDFVAVGAFFSQTFISFVGGDAMRVWRMVRSRIPVASAAKSVLFDRVAGFAGMFILVLVSSPFLLPILDSPEMTIGLLLILLGGLGAALVMLVLRRIPQAWFRGKILHLLRSVIGAGLDIWRTRQGALFVVGLSVGIQLLNVIILLQLAAGLHVEISITSGLLLFPTVLFLSMLPISVAGWGVREGAMIAALGLINIPAYQSVALSVCFGICLIVVSLPGGLLWFTSRAAHLEGERAADAARELHPHDSAGDVR
jgi:glycosyltransferase 2 family protein